MSTNVPEELDCEVAGNCAGPLPHAARGWTDTTTQELETKHELRARAGTMTLETSQNLLCC